MRVKEFLYFIILKFKNRSAKIPATDLEITEALYNTNLVTIPNLGKEIKLPPFDIWTLAPDSLIFILNYIKKHNLKSVLELGSGLSTVAIAGIFQQSNFENQVIVSLEQDQKYQDQTTKWLTKNKLTKFTRIINSPLIEYSIQNKKWWWYDIKNLDPSRKFDLIIVDGPVGTAGELNRFPAVPLLLDRLSDDGIIILDDYNRPDETKIVEMWLKMFPELKLKKVKTLKGMAIISKKINLKIAKKWLKNIVA